MVTAPPTRLPPLPQPPHDPRWLLLDGRTGWRDALRRNVEATFDGRITLARLPEAGRLAAEPAGSIGGLVPPIGTALAPDGTLFLLDKRGPALKVFDPCECRFVAVPGLGGAGAGARQFQDPAAITVCSGHLYVCDQGNARVSVFALRGYALLGHWRPPAAATPTQPWQPVAVACDGHARVYVADRANGRVHRFHRSGRWETSFTGVGTVLQIAVDTCDRLYVLSEGNAGVRIFDGDGQDAGSATRPEEIAGNFRRLPFAVDAKGRLHVSELCAPSQRCACSGSCDCGGRAPGGSDHVFDLNGEPVEIKAGPPALSYNDTGVWVAGPLDSEIYRCQWHRVLLEGEAPPGTRLTVSTVTAEVEQPLDLLLEAEDLWGTRQEVRTEEAGWDCMVHSNGGRYLWLRLQLTGNGFVTPSISSVRIEFPRVSLRRYLPAVYGAEPVSTDFTDRFLSLFDTTLRGVEHEVDNQARFYDPLSAPSNATGGSADFLGWLASWVGVAVDRQWSEARRRQWLKQAARLYPLRGTRAGLRQALLIFLGMEAEHLCCPCDGPRTSCSCPPANCEIPEERPCAWQPPKLILEHFELRRWLFVGRGRLGDQAMLWGQRIVNRSQLDAGAQAAQVGETKLISTPDPFHDPFRVYSHRFSVFVPACYGESEMQRRALENLVQAEKPAHTLVQIEYVRPLFRIGRQSMLGYDAVVGRYPEGITLNETALGGDSVIGGSPGQSDQPGLVVGKQSRVGATTRLA